MARKIFIMLFALLLLPHVSSAAPILSATPTQSGGTLIDFEGQTNGANADSLYASLGVTFSSAAGNTIIWNPFAAGNQVASSGTGVLGPSGPAQDPFSMHFASGQSFVEFFFADPNPINGATTYTMTAFDAANAVLESFVIPASSLPGTFYAGFARAGADIRRIDIDPSNGGENFNVDDLRFSVPEPGTLALLGLGLAGLAASRRRKQ